MTTFLLEFGGIVLDRFIRNLDNRDRGFKSGNHDHEAMQGVLTCPKLPSCQSWVGRLGGGAARQTVYTQFVSAARGLGAVQDSLASLGVVQQAKRVNR